MGEWGNHNIMIINASGMPSFSSHLLAVQSLPGTSGMDNGKDQPIRRSTRLSRRQDQGGARRGRSSTGGDPNKK